MNYLEPAGTHRNPTWTNLDLMAAYRLPTAGRTRISLEARLLNVFDAQTQLSTDAQQYLDLQHHSGAAVFRTLYSPESVLRDRQRVRATAPSFPRRERDVLSKLWSPIRVGGRSSCITINKCPKPRAFTLIRCDFDGAAAWIQVTNQRTPTSTAIVTPTTAFLSPQP